MNLKRVGGLLVVFLFLVSLSLEAFAASGGILQGNYSVYKDGKIVNKLAGKNPLVEDSLLVCNGKCVVNSNGISLVAAENAIFAVKDQGNRFNLLVKQGRVDFTLLNTSHKIAFFTPDGSYTVGNGLVKASSGSSLRGYMQVINGKAEVGLYEGSMVFATAEGPQTVNANEKIILAMAEIPENGGGAPEPSKEVGASFWSQHKIPIIATGVVAVGTGVGVGVAVSGDDDHHHEASPNK